MIELFGEESIFTEENGYGGGYYRNGYNRSYIFTVIVGELPAKEDSENLLSNCIILNTYSAYFTSNTGFENIQIVCGEECYDSYFEMTLNYQKDILGEQVPFNAPLAIDELIKINTSAKRELNGDFSPTGFYHYNFIFTELEKILNHMKNEFT